MAILTSKKPSATYKSLLQVGTADNQEIVLDTLKVIEDGAGGDTALSLAKTGSTIGAEFAGNVDLADGNLVITSATKGIVHTNSGTITQGTSATTAVTLNTTSGVIRVYAATLATNTEVQFTVNNSTVQADSVILCTMQDENTDANSHLLVTTNTIASGSFIINLFNCGSGTASETASYIHFLVINNS
jgi:hypothetical protein